MKKYFYCRSYPAFLYALWLSIEEQIVIISSSTDIIQACKLLEKEIVVMKQIDRSIITKEYKNVIKETKRVINIIDNHELIFSHKEFDVQGFILFSEYQKKGGCLTYLNFEIESPTLQNIIFSYNYLNKVIQKIKLYVIYNLPIEFHSQGKNQIVFSLKNSFFRKQNIKCIDIRNIYSNNILKLINNITINLPKIENLFIAQYLLDKNTFKQEKISELITFLEKNDIPIKKHPNDNINIVERIELKQFIPVEFYFKHINNTVISIYSLSLITASKINNINSISLLDMGFIIDEDLRISMKNKLSNESNGKIRFPKTYQELYTYILPQDNGNPNIVTSSKNKYQE